MADIISILGLAKIAGDLVKPAMQADAAVRDASLKMQLADLMGVIAEMKSGTLDLRDQLIEQDSEISALHEPLQLKATVVQFGSAYYDINREGKAVGKAFCLRCWEEDHKL